MLLRQNGAPPNKSLQQMAKLSLSLVARHTGDIPVPKWDKEVNQS